jgi:tetratricopeptide (TPR) repeat protein
MNSLAVALAKAGRGADAVERARAWVAAAPADPERRFTLALAQADQDVDASMATLRQVLAAQPDHALAQHNLALLLKRMDRTEEAIDAARRAIAIQPRAEAHLVLGGLYAQQEAFGPAVSALEAAVAADPRSVESWMLLGSVHETRGDLSRAADAFRKAIALRPDAWSAYAALAIVLRRQGDPAGADRASADAERRRIRERAEREAVVLTAVGVASLDAGDAETARVRFGAALAADERYAPAHYHLGRALQRLRRPDEARAAYARAYELNPALVPPAAGK